MGPDARRWEIHDDPRESACGINQVHMPRRRQQCFKLLFRLSRQLRARTIKGGECVGGRMNGLCCRVVARQRLVGIDRVRHGEGTFGEWIDLTTLPVTAPHATLLPHLPCCLAGSLEAVHHGNQQERHDQRGPDDVQARGEKL